MRDEEDPTFGQFTVRHAGTKDGDNRSAFVVQHLGHCIHHLYLWHLSDEMGVLSNVLNKLSKNVATESSKVPADTAQVQ